MSLSVCKQRLCAQLHIALQDRGHGRVLDRRPDNRRAMSEATAAELLFSPATELAAQVRDGEISARELVGLALDRIEAVNPQVNALVHVDPDGALDAADRISAGDHRPFAGVPIGVKDLYAVAGMPLTFGSNAFADHRPTEDPAP